MGGGTITALRLYPSISFERHTWPLAYTPTLPILGENGLLFSPACQKSVPSKFNSYDHFTNIKRALNLLLLCSSSGVFLRYSGFPLSPNHACSIQLHSETQAALHKRHRTAPELNSVMFGYGSSYTLPQGDASRSVHKLP